MVARLEFINYYITEVVLKGKKRCFHTWMDFFVGGEIRFRRKGFAASFTSVFRITRVHVIHMSLEAAQMPEFFAAKVADERLFLSTWSCQRNKNSIHFKGWGWPKCLRRTYLRLFLDGGRRRGASWHGWSGGEDTGHAGEHCGKVRSGMVTEHGG